MEANNKMDEMVYQFISHISDNIITEFITKTFYHDIITNQEIYFKEENGQVADGKIMLSTKNMSFRFILLWRQFITCNPLYKTSVVVKMEKKDNVLVNIISKASSSNVTVESINLINNSDYQTYNLVVLVENVAKLKNFLNELYQMKEVVEVERLIQ